MMVDPMGAFILDYSGGERNVRLSKANKM